MLQVARFEVRNRDSMPEALVNTPRTGLPSGSCRMAMFSQRYALFAALSILAALCLRAPALQVGLLADDWDHYAMSEGIYPVKRGAFDHFDFVRRAASEHEALQAAGRLPWWSSPNLQMALLRPLSSALGHVDYAWLAGAQHPFRMHLHSLMWWLLLVTGVACLLPLLLPLPAAALATLLYAFEDAHILPVTWIANRSELVANAFVVWALFFQVLAARRHARGLELASHGLVACALLAGEHSIPALAYLAAFQLCRKDLQIAERARQLIPLAVLVVGFIVLRGAAGYGAAGVGMYVEPLANPLRYFEACVGRVPLLFGDVVFGVAADWFPGGPPAQSWWTALSLPGGGPGWPRFQMATGWAALSIVIAGLALFRRSQPTLFWLLLAAAASIVPMCASVAMGRLTLPAALGVDAVLAWCTYELARRALSSRRIGSSAAAVVVGAAVLGVHGAGAGLRAWREPHFYASVSELETAWVRLDGLDLRDRHVFTLTSGPAAQWVIPYVRHLHGLSMPASSTPLSAAFLSPHELIRTADNVLELQLAARPEGATFTDSVYRSADNPFHPGDQIRAPRFDVTVLAADRGEPTWLRFTFPSSLESNEYLFLYARPRGLAPLTLPAVGQRVTFGPSAWPAAPPLDQASTMPRTSGSPSSATRHDNPPSSVAYTQPSPPATAARRPRAASWRAFK
jgi:hypothetical protein